MNAKGFGRKQLWHNLKYYPDINVDKSLVKVGCIVMEIRMEYIPNASGKPCLFSQTAA
jgi:hypothetical protein